MNALIKIVIVLVIVLLLSRRTTLGIVLIGASLLLLLLFSISPKESWLIIKHSFSNQENIELLANISCIILLGNVLYHTGGLRRLVGVMQSFLRKPLLVMISLPTLIGLLPMPGGALFSAPLVSASSPTKDVSPEVLAFINYWFRHIWEYFLPLYPGVLLAASLTGLSPSWIFLHHLPFALLALISGWWIVSKTVNIETQKAIIVDDPETVNTAEIIGLFSSLLIPVIGLFLGIPIWEGAIISIILTLFTQKVPYQKIGAFIFRETRWLTILDVVGVIIFKTVILESGSIEIMVSFLVNQKVPIILLGVAVSFLTGFITGLTSAFIGITFPLIFPLFQLGEIKAVLPLVYLSGFSGILLSPTHLCFTLTCRYFKVDSGKIYKLLAFPMIVVYVEGVIRWLIVS